MMLPSRRRNRGLASGLVFTSLLLAGCGGADNPKAAEATAVNQPASASAATCTEDTCALTGADLQKVIAQAIAEARARNVAATIAIVDRVGNVLGVARTTGAPAYVTVSSNFELGPAVSGGLDGLNFIPSSLAAIAKAVTGAYLSTGGNAFSSRTASQIIQENFNPGERDVPSGPLFGVQFSQLPCSDFSQRFTAGVGVGPHRSPLGLAADPGGLPLYMNGVPVGGVGVVADGVYGLDKDISNRDFDLDELIAVAATFGYAAPTAIRADQISLGGKTGRFTDVGVNDLLTDPAAAATFATLTAGGIIQLQSVPGYYDAAAGLLAGTVFGQPASGIRAADGSVFKSVRGESLDAFIFVDAANSNRYPARDGVDTPDGDPGKRMTATEVQTLLNEAIDLANHSRAQIRLPAGSKARVTVSIVDSGGAILGMARTRDGPMFGADVSLQKARTATFFSGTGNLPGKAPAELLRPLPPPRYLAPLTTPLNLAQLSVLSVPAPTFADYVDAVQVFLGDAGALESFGTPVAFADRSGGNLSRPHYPDGPSGGVPGPFSKPPGEWSVFSVGLQSDLVYNALIHHVAYVLGTTTDVEPNCIGDTGFGAGFRHEHGFAHLANGMQIFPGSVPIYRGDTLVGGIGVSGDGVDQDDMISFLALHRTGQRLRSIGNAPVAMRADQLDIPGQSSRLRYISCPQVPFIGSNETDVCNGI